MSASRTSNKQILEAIQSQTESIDKLVNVLAQNAAPAASAPAIVNNDDDNKIPEGNVEVDKGYHAHMLEKVQAFADTKGEDVVLYGRRNNRGETKLAYCLASKFATLRDRGLIGATDVVSPSS